MRKGKIIVADDEENIRSSLEGILHDEGYEVICAADGETTLRLVEAETPDLVLLDIWMPGIDGLQTLKILKNIDADTEVVMMSGHGTIETAVKATKMGAFDFIEKPLSLDSTLRVVAKALKNRRSRNARGRDARVEGSIMERRFIGNSKAAREARRQIRESAAATGSVLIRGEIGLGKKFAARMIHNLSDRRDKPFIEISCDGLSKNDLMEIVFAGTTGGVGNGVPRFDAAMGGMIFFDRINRLSPQAQETLFFALTEKGGEDVRILASLVDERAGKKNVTLDEGLEKLLGGSVVRLVPIRQRKTDIPDFIEKFVDDMCDEFGKHIESVDPEVMETLSSLPWPGNLKELREVIEKSVLQCNGAILTTESLPPLGQTVSAPEPSRYENGHSKQEELPLIDGAARKLRQRTLKNSVVLTGQGLHSGIKTGMIMSPLPPNSGIYFGDISTGSKVAALLENVRSTEYATTLSAGHVTIKTIEHIMSALHSYRITNLLIKIGDEAPIMDGSAIDFCQIIENSGIEEQDGEVEEITVDEPISVGDPEKGPYLCVEPAAKFSVHYSLDYPPPIGKQEHVYEYEGGEHYKETIAPARTFGFVKDIKKLEEMGLGGGGKLSNFILIDDEKVVNTQMRFPNEPARHKILDLIGDLYLLGRPVRGRFIAIKSGHTQNIALLTKIRERMSGSPFVNGVGYHVAGR